MRFISLLMTLAMVFVLAGCGSNGNTQPVVSHETNGEIAAGAPEGDDAAAEVESVSEKRYNEGEIS